MCGSTQHARSLTGFIEWPTCASLPVCNAPHESSVHFVVFDLYYQQRWHHMSNFFGSPADGYRCAMHPRLLICVANSRSSCGKGRLPYEGVLILPCFLCYLVTLLRKCFPVLMCIQPATGCPWGRMNPSHTLTSAMSSSMIR